MRSLTPTRRVADDDGATAAEYAVMLALIVAVILTAIHAVGNTSTGIWANNTGKIQAAIQNP